MRKVVAIAVILCLLLVGCSPAASEVPPLAYEPEEYEEYLPELPEPEPEPLPEIYLPEEPEEEEPTAEDFEPAGNAAPDHAPVVISPPEVPEGESPPPAQVTHAAQTDQIIIGHYWPAANIDWEATITDLNDIASIEGFLRDRRPVQYDGPPFVGGIPPHINLELDGVPMSFNLLGFSIPGVPPDRYVIGRYGGLYSVDWRIWRVLSRYGGFDDMDLRSALPPLQLSWPESEPFTIGQVLERSGAQFGSLWNINVAAFAGESHLQTNITDATQMQEIFAALTNVRLKTRDAPVVLDWASPSVVIRLYTDDFSVNFTLYETTADHFMPPMYQRTSFTYYGPEGPQFRAMLAGLVLPAPS